ncbi:MAG: hypothetical protein AVDCRST_MAG18-4593 [uncultured Thermomicrobiales bacterium]|uniref:Uncharacterized protein n=1 Tax=uncultured Thermomicrobiales bacterium TaxID=1645740 RepID=A0A6J4VWK0_9BACT|nr:MAG: hypothetical protein AVDCRST_MAG18-4593 [uncultured Thermomicrobiales bacterium]
MGLLTSFERYTVRYRCSDRRGRTALIVEDSAGAAYLFTSGTLQGRMGGNNASTRLAKRLEQVAHWRQVPRVAPYTLDGLRQMAG